MCDEISVGVDCNEDINDYLWMMEGENYMIMPCFTCRAVINVRIGYRITDDGDDSGVNFGNKQIRTSGWQDEITRPRE